MGRPATVASVSDGLDSNADELSDFGMRRRHPEVVDEVRSDRVGAKRAGPTQLGPDTEAAEAEAVVLASDDDGPILDLLKTDAWRGIKDRHQL